MPEPLISIIIANYNKSAFISETIDSVKKQSYKHWELIIVDDCSTDTSLAVIDNFSEDNRIRLIKNEINKGANFCRNLGIFIALGTYILFLDADDLLATECLQSRLNAALSFPNSNFLIFSMGVFYKKVGDDQRAWIPDSKKPLQDFLQHDLPWSILQPFWKKEFLENLNGFDESFLRLQDVELNTRALLHKNLSLKIIGGAPDCFYRIDEERKNYDSFAFLNRWIESATRYCDKFWPLVSKQDQKYLPGTIYQTYLALLNQFKAKLISKENFDLLESKLLNALRVNGFSTAKKYLFSFSKYYNLYCFRIPGLNKILKSLTII